MSDSPPLSYRYLRPEDIQRLGGFEYAPKLVVEGYLSGRHACRSRGASIEFHDYRSYSEGDDLATVDWRVFARTDRLYVKTFEQEADLECHVLLDSSASMGSGGEPGKLDFASFFAAALCYLVIRGRDRASLHLFDETLRHSMPSGSTRGHLHSLLNLLENNRPGGPTSIATSLRKLYPLIKRRGTLVVISDFYDDAGEIFSALSPYLHRGFRVHLFHVLTPLELKMDLEGFFTFLDAESGGKLVVRCEEMREPYTEAMGVHMQAMRQLAARRNVDYALARTDGSLFDLFDHFLR